ncbi:hypothetical protein [Acidithiobacillus sp.]|uniref:hypothetical protein n=1 Tax=Acidithiobacillus sp. TaxID=1872118 RepID=UPI00231539E3|nr:hypothetical protein [Acidithiobacillus sp.]MDA8246105.1 hypothetical protein [Acidithiobacillus sp.]
MYILDTSALRSIGTDDLIKVKEKVNIGISTITAFELASHLTRDLTNHEHLRKRGNFLKGRIPQLLDDPFVLWAQRTSGLVNPHRKEDKILILQLFNAVEESPTLEELRSKIFYYSDGMKASFLDIGDMVYRALKKEEENYCSKITPLLSDSSKLHKVGSKFIITTEVLKANIVNAIGNKLVDHAPCIRSEILSHALFTGYMLHRLYYYANKMTGSSQLANQDLNDCEDAYICLSLNLMAGDVLVTDDNGMFNAVKETFKQICEFLDPPLKQECCVITTKDFLNITRE